MRSCSWRASACRRGSLGTRTRPGRRARVAVARERGHVGQRARLGAAVVARGACRASGRPACPLRPGDRQRRRRRSAELALVHRGQQRRRRPSARCGWRARAPSRRPRVVRIPAARRRRARRRRRRSWSRPPPKRAPSALISVSAKKLSDGHVHRGDEALRSSARAPASVDGARRRRAAPRAAAQPSRRGGAAPRANALAANSGGLAWNSGRRRPVKPRLKVRALSGPTQPELR